MDVFSRCPGRGVFGQVSGVASAEARKAHEARESVFVALI